MKTHKTNNPTTRTAARALAAALLLLAAGCHDAQSQMERERANDTFAPEGDTRAYRRATAAEVAAGARKDGMLYDYHFDGDRLNSLGQQKLSLMLRANDQAFPVVVYMNVPSDDHLTARKDAVTRYMTDAGLRHEQVALEFGANPNVSSSAAQNLMRYNKTEDVSTTGSNPTSPQAPGYGVGGGPGDSGTGH